jgi:uncharacterized phage protein gp47/JayE
MPAGNGFFRRTLPELIEQAQADIEANLPGANARLAQSNLDVLAISAAGLADEQLDAIDHAARQIHVTTATGVGLGRHGSEWRVPRKDAQRSTGTLLASTSGPAALPSGSLFATETGIQVRTTAVGVPVGPQLSAPIRAELPGVAGNLVAGTQLNTVNSIGGIVGAVVPALMIGGTDQEQQEAWRSRILDRIQRPPQGGAESDYVRWALEFPGVTRAWVFPREQGTGTVVVRFAMDDTYPGGIPTEADARALLAYIEPLRPVTAELFVYAPVARPIDVVVRDLVPRNEDTERAIADELADMLFREGVPGGTIAINWIWEAVSIASGVRTHKIDLPADDVILQVGELPTVGDINYVLSRALHYR